MTTVAILNTIVVFFAYLGRYKGYEFFLKVAFFIIFLFLALRYDYGNDYRAYLEAFWRITRYSEPDNLNTERYEPGWQLLYHLFKPFGFFALIAVLSAFNSFVYYRFIKRYVSPDYYWFSVFLYVFNFNFMLINTSAIRQSLAINLFIFSIDYLYKKDITRYFLCIGMASLFHKSALILIPVYFIGAMNWRLNRAYAFMIFCFFMLLVFGGNLFLSNIADFINGYFPEYAVYTDTSVESKSGGTKLGVLFTIFLFTLVLYYATLQDNKNIVVFKIAILSFLVYPLTWMIFLLDRIQYYFLIAIIVVYPIILLNVKNIVYRSIIIILIIIITLHSFNSFFNIDIYFDYFKTYQTIFSSPHYY
jgi:transmembrane protein EpsG